MSSLGAHLLCNSCNFVALLLWVPVGIMLNMNNTDNNKYIFENFDKQYNNVSDYN